MAHGGDLSNDLVFRILARLPVKSLLRFAVVCRRWRHVIMYDRNFARAQLQAARDHPSQRHRRLLVSAKKPRIQSFHLEKETETASFAVRQANNFPHSEQVTLLGSFNGLVFVTPFSGGEWVCVWNPSTYNAFKQLPDPKFDMVVDGYDGADVDWNVFFGVGHVAATDDYKVLVAHSECYESDDEEDDDGGSTTAVEIKMFSMRSNCWKTIKPLKESLKSDKTPATVVRERLHWISTGFGHEIVAFDLEKEELETMPLPDMYDNLFKISNFFKVSRLGVSAGGCLCMVRFPIEQDSGCDSFMDFWVMTEYGVAGSWEKLYRFSYRSWGWCDEMLVTEKCTVAAMRKTTWDEERTKLIRIEHKDEKEQQFGRYTTLRRAVDSMLEYEETLIRYDYDDDLSLDGI